MLTVLLVEAEFISMKFQEGKAINEFHRIEKW